jgi:uncharacterized membrane-anchored protein
MKKSALLLALAAALILPATIAARAPPAPVPAPANAQDAAAAQAARDRAILGRLHPVSGDVRIIGANAVLHLGRDYYFLPAAEARIVLTEGWSNPPGSVANVLGMVFPAGKTFADPDAWGAVITYEATGYVSDSDAASTNYDELLVTLRGDEEAINAERARQGYPAMHLVGWAQQPVYDPRTHSVVWAQNIQFVGQTENTLNYDIRLLGRRGVLSLNMITSMSRLADTREAARRLATSATFNQGERYADYQPGDPTAEYGIAGLIAAGTGVAIAKKAGLLAVILAFGKKFILLIVAGFALLAAAIRRFFGRREEAEEPACYEEAPVEAAPPPDAPTEADVAPSQS